MKTVSRIREARGDLGMTQKQVAEKAGVGAVDVSNAERGLLRNAVKITKIGEVLGFSAEEAMASVEEVREAEKARWRAEMEAMETRRQARAPVTERQLGGLALRAYAFSAAERVSGMLAKLGECVSRDFTHVTGVELSLQERRAYVHGYAKPSEAPSEASRENADVEEEAA
jgi:transcriptional regulator with XRE-family HTH domain